MRISPLIAALLASLSFSAQAFDLNDLGAIGKTLLGGLAGGVAGNQVGQGRGNTAATAIGAAAGAVYASDCKPTAMSAVGALLGGLVGSQIGDGNGKKVMAATGAIAGALAGSECGPVVATGKPAPLPNAKPYLINGVKAIPMTGFPAQAFAGLPPIVTLADLAAVNQASLRFAQAAQQSFQSGQTDTAMLEMYWAKRLAAQSASITSASSQALMTSDGKTISVPPKALIILPAFNQHRTDGPAKLSGLNLSSGIQVASNSDNLDALLGISQVTPAPQPSPLRSASSAPQFSLQGIPLNVVYALPDGTQVFKNSESLTIYNGGTQMVKLPLDKLDFVPRTPEPTQARKDAADLMFAMNDNLGEWTFTQYAQKHASFQVVSQAPNKIVDLKSTRGMAAVSYFDEIGNVTSDPKPGLAAYKKQASYRKASDLLQASYSATLDATTQCRGRYGNFDVLNGKYANIVQANSFTGKYPNFNVVYTKTLFIGEDGKAIQTLESLMQDKASQAVMNQALQTGESVSNLAFLAGPLSNVEDGLQCLGQTTLAQHAFLSNITAKQREQARLAGWQPPSNDEWSPSRIANCVGMIPVAGNLAHGAVLAGKALTGTEILAKTANPTMVSKVLNLFESPSDLKSFVEGTRNAADLYPNNPRAAQLIKGIYDVAMTSATFSQALDSFSYFRK